jgi:uncharacterized membrane protein
VVTDRPAMDPYAALNVLGLVMIVLAIVGVSVGVALVASAAWAVLTGSASLGALGVAFATRRRPAEAADTRG